MPKFILLEAEHIRNIYRQSKFFLLKPVMFTVLAITVPIYLLNKYDLLTHFQVQLYIFVVIVLMWFIRTLIIWHRNSYVVTNKRLLVFKHNGLFSRVVMDNPLERILNISYKTTGIFSTIVDYGDVEVQVVGLVEPVILEHIAEPAIIKDYLWEMHQRAITKPVSFDTNMINKYQEQMGYIKKNQRIK